MAIDGMPPSSLIKLIDNDDPKDALLNIKA
jgi:hypothetical protein